MEPIHNYAADDHATHVARLHTSKGLIAQAHKDLLDQVAALRTKVSEGGAITVTDLDDIRDKLGNVDKTASDIVVPGAPAGAALLATPPVGKAEADRKAALLRGMPGGDNRRVLAVRRVSKAKFTGTDHRVNDERRQS